MNSYTKRGGAARRRFCVICKKPEGGGGNQPPPGCARVKLNGAASLPERTSLYDTQFSVATPMQLPLFTMLGV